MKEEPPPGEGFLGRWARVKREATRPAAPPPEPAAPPVPAETAPVAEAETEQGPPPPDPASIDAETDITPWLARKVSDEWKNAALRQVWATTPGIRDFVGLQDYDWDFNNPNSIPGFADSVEPDVVKQVLASVFGTPKAEAEQEPAMAAEEDELHPTAPAAEPAGSIEAPPSDPVRLAEVPVPDPAGEVAAIAEAPAGPPPRVARRGGGALPG